MRLSELLKAEVLDRDGERVGHVHDVRFVRDGPYRGTFGPAYRLEGLIVGVGSLGHRLGFDRGHVKGPLPIKRFFDRLHRRTRLVEWGLIESIDAGVIRLEVPAGDLPEVPLLQE